MGNNNFYSVDRLMEFGMSLAISQQMVKSMNEMMRNMLIPGAMNPMQKSTSQEGSLVFYAIIDGKQAGPFSETELTRLITERRITKETYVWIPGMKDWQLAENTPSVLRLVALTPPDFRPV